MNLWSRFLHGKCRGYFRFNAICTLNQTVCSSYIIFKCSLCCQCIVIAILLSKLLWIGFVIRITVNLTINIYRTAFIIFYLTSKGAEYQFYANRIFDAFLLWTRNIPGIEWNGVVRTTQIQQFTALNCADMRRISICVCTFIRRRISIYPDFHQFTGTVRITARCLWRAEYILVQTNLCHLETTSAFFLRRIRFLSAGCFIRSILRLIVIQRKFYPQYWLRHGTFWIISEENVIIGIFLILVRNICQRASFSAVLYCSHFNRSLRRW